MAKHQHIVSSYDDELRHLNETVARMGGIAETELASAVEAVVKRDRALAEKVIESDADVDALEQEIDQCCLRLFALRQPVADDLREIIAALKISSDLERIGDYGKNIGKRAIALSHTPPIKPQFAIPRMARMAQGMIKDILDAYVQRDADKAHDVWERDEELDEMYNSLFRELLTYMMEDPRSISACTHLLFIAKNIERVGDHATNIGEIIHFLVHGTHIEEERPKGDTTSSNVITAAPESDLVARSRDGT
ncbi:MAG: phosphate signaling complex protein PhoU [Alphaproteobacteria bacterium]|nr:phosphate signaling complex protein PhoU [Alphaproteobacteria bacterium]